MKQDADKSAAVATVVAAVDMARVREPVISAVEQTAQRTTTTAVHVQPAQEQVRVRLPWGTCRAASFSARLLNHHPLSFACSNAQFILKTALSPAGPRLLELSEQKVV